MPNMTTEPTDWTDAEIVEPGPEDLSPPSPSIEDEVKRITLTFNSISDQARLKFMEKLVKYSSNNIKIMLDKMEKGIL